MALPVLAGIIWVASPPFLLAVPADLAVHGIGFHLTVVILSLAVPPTVWTPTNDLVRMEAGRLEESLAIAAGAVAHRALRIEMALNCERPLAAVNSDPS